MVAMEWQPAPVSDQLRIALDEAAQPGRPLSREACLYIAAATLREGRVAVDALSDDRLVEVMAFCLSSKGGVAADRAGEVLREAKSKRLQARVAQKGKNMSDAIHPASAEFTAAQLADDAILRYFHYAHLPVFLQSASKPFCDLARMIVETLPRNAERSVALRKLLEAKDAAVRANVA